MSDYEWEPRRVPRPPKAELLANYRPHYRAVAEFAALEHPRESVGWILRLHARSKSRSPTDPPTGASVSNRRLKTPSPPDGE